MLKAEPGGRSQDRTEFLTNYSYDEHARQPTRRQIQFRAQHPTPKKSSTSTESPRAVNAKNGHKQHQVKSILIAEKSRTSKDARKPSSSPTEKESKSSQKVRTEKSDEPQLISREICPIYNDKQSDGTIGAIIGSKSKKSNDIKKEHVVSAKSKSVVIVKKPTSKTIPEPPKLEKPIIVARISTRWDTDSATKNSMVSHSRLNEKAHQADRAHRLLSGNQRYKTSYETEVQDEKTTSAEEKNRVYKLKLQTLDSHRVFGPNPTTLARPSTEGGLRRSHSFVGSTIASRTYKIFSTDSPYKFIVSPKISPRSSNQPKQNLVGEHQDNHPSEILSGSEENGVKSNRDEKVCDNRESTKLIYKQVLEAPGRRRQPYGTKPIIRSQSFHGNHKMTELVDNMSISQDKVKTPRGSAASSKSCSPRRNQGDEKHFKRDTKSATSRRKDFEKQSESGKDIALEDDKVTIKKSNSSLSASSQEDKIVSFSKEFSIQNGDLCDYIRLLHSEKLQLKTENSANHLGKTLVEDIMQKAISDVMARSVQSLQYGQVLAPFDPQDPLFGGDLVVQVSPKIFRVRVFIENPFPPGTFQLMTGVRYGLPSGQGLLCLNPAGLTMVERRQVQKMYKPFFDGDFFSPTKSAQWIQKGLQESFEKMQGIKWNGRYIYAKSSMVNGRIAVTVVSMNKDGDKEEVFNVYVFPAMQTSGWPSSACLQHPLPRQRPHAIQGQQMLKEVKNMIEDGAKLICLEGMCRAPSSHVGKTAGGGSGSSSRPQTTNGRVQQMAAASIVHGNAWMVNYRNAEKLLMEKLFRCDIMNEAMVAYDVLGFMQERNQSWGILTPAVRRTIMLWTVKRSGIDNKTSADWLLAFLGFSLKAFGSGYCPQFFQPNVNMLSGIDKECFSYVTSDFQTILQEIDERPDVITKFCK